MIVDVIKFLEMVQIMEGFVCYFQEFEYYFFFKLQDLVLRQVMI